MGRETMRDRKWKEEREQTGRDRKIEIVYIHIKRGEWNRNREVVRERKRQGERKQTEREIASEREIRYR